MIAAVLVGRRDQPATRHDPDPSQSLLAFVLVAVAIGVVEYLAGHVRAVEGRIRHQPHGRVRFRRQRRAGRGVDRLCAIRELALADAGADREQQLDAVLARTVERQVGPDEFAADDVRLEFGIVEPGRPLHVAESGAAGMRSITPTPVRSTPKVLLTVMTYGTIWPRVTLTIGVVLVTATAPPRSWSSGMWLLNS